MDCRLLNSSVIRSIVRLLVRGSFRTPGRCYDLRLRSFGSRSTATELLRLRIPVLTGSDRHMARGRARAPGEMPGEHKRPFVLHFSETDRLLRWHWYCRGKKGSRSCGATPVRKAVEFEEWIGEKGLWSWTDHRSEERRVG